MGPTLISAPDAIAPSFTRARQLLLSPFRWSIWWRLALVSMVISGEIWGNLFNMSDLLRATRGARRGGQDFIAGPSLPPILSGLSTAKIALLIAVVASLMLLLVLIHIYIGSVVRFILFDAVATGRYRLRAGWKLWEPAGRRLFAFNLLLVLIFLVVIGGIVGVLVAGLMSMGVGKAGPGASNPALAIAAVLLMIPMILIVAVVAYVLVTIAYDLGLPMMAIEGLAGTAAFRKAWTMVRAAKGDYAAYIGLKFVLGIALGIALAIVQFMILVPLFFFVVFVVAAMGIGIPELLSNPVLLAALITVAFLGFIVLSFVLALLAVPLRVIFQSYALIFFAPRYLPLYRLLYGEPPAPPAAPVAGPDAEPPLFPPESVPAI
jgi:hypothetical protein